MVEQPALTEEKRAELQQRLEEIAARPHAGRLARKLRKRQKLSAKDIAELVGVKQDDVALAEKSGDITAIAIKAAVACALDGQDEDCSAELVNRYVALLEPTADEEQVLRHDVREDLAWLIDTLKALLPPELWEEIKNRPPPDPWASDGTKERRRQVRPKRPSLSPLNDVGARLGGTTAPNEVTQSGGSNALEDICWQADESRDCSFVATKERVANFKLRVVTVIDGQEVETVDVSVLAKTFDRMEDIGLTLAESKQILKDLQQHIVRRQAEAFVDSRSGCGDCNRRLGSKGSHDISFRTLFGTVGLKSPRFRRCGCRSAQA